MLVGKENYKMRLLKSICNILTVVVLIKSSEPDKKKQIVEGRFQIDFLVRSVAFTDHKV